MKLYIKKGNYGYSTRLKNEYNGKTSEMWLDVQFSREDKPEDNCRIEVLDSFLSCYDSKDGVKPKLIVLGYRIIEEDKPKEKVPSDTDVYFDDIKVDDEFNDSLPF